LPFGTFPAGPPSSHYRDFRLECFREAWESPEEAKELVPGSETTNPITKVGSVPGKRFGGTPKTFEPPPEVYSIIGEEIKDFTWPGKLTPTQVMHAVHYAVGQKKFTGTMPPSSYEYFYNTFSWTPVKDLSDTFVSRDVLYYRAVDIVGRMKLQKTPGFPLNQVYATNLAALQSMGPEICLAAADMVWRWMTHDPSLPPPLFQDAVRLNYTECTVPFVKNEPHPLRKSKEGHWRIVNSVSLVFQIAERVILTGFIDTVKFHYGNVEPTVGIGFNEELATSFAERLYADIADLGVPGVLYSEDIKGWDRTVTVHDVTLAGHIACENIRKSRMSYDKLKQAIHMHAMYMTHPCMLIHDGNMWNLCVTSPGCMLSGSTLTTTYNSIIRAVKARSTGALLSRCAGDDALTYRPVNQTLEEFEGLYRSIGLTARESTAWTEDEFSFCSHRFFRTGNGWDTYLESVVKGIYRALTRFQTFESFSGIMSELRNHPEEYLYGLVLRTYVTYAPGEVTGDKI
jgi:hypothetical protein